MHWYLDVLKKYVTTKGRAGRSEFWYFHLVDLLVLWMLYLVAVVGSGREEDIITIIVLYFFGTFLPRIAVAIRRLHDTGTTGWAVSLTILPVLNLILLLLYCSDGQHGPNKYGEDPKKRSPRILENTM